MGANGACVAGAQPCIDRHNRDDRHRHGVLDMGSPSSGASGSGTTYDGGGLGMGTGTPLTRQRGKRPENMQHKTQAAQQSSSAAIVRSSSPGGVSRTGNSVGSVQIG